MRTVVGLGVAFAAVGCNVGEAGPPSRTASDAVSSERVSASASLRDASVDDDLAESLARAQEPAPAPRITHSISLGFLGDSKIGVLPTPPHYEPAWTRPFPCDWTDTCWAYPPPGYAPQYTQHLPYAPCPP
jgi:hypothetical protein